MWLNVFSVVLATNNIIHPSVGITKTYNKSAGGNGRQRTQPGGSGGAQHCHHFDIPQRKVDE